MTSATGTSATGTPATGTPAAGTPALEARGLVKSFGANRVLDGLDLVLEQGSVVALMGANGAGKSTLLDLVCGLTEANQGTLQVMGQRARVAVRRGRVGAMLQSGGLLADLTVAETAELFVRLHGNQVDAAELLERVGLAGRQDRRVAACSGGEQQRLRWALAQASAPQLLVLDEPTAGMDWLGRRDFWEQVRDLVDQGCTVFYSTHYADEVDEVAQRVVLLHQGRLVADAAADELRAGVASGNLFDALAQAIGGQP